MSEQRKNTGTRKRATKKDTENKTTRTRKRLPEEQRAVQQNEEAEPDRVKAEEEQIRPRAGTDGGKIGA